MSEIPTRQFAKPISYENWRNKLLTLRPETEVKLEVETNGGSWAIAQIAGRTIATWHSPPTEDE